MNSVICAIILCALPSLGQSLEVKKLSVPNTDTHYGHSVTSHINTAEVCIGTPPQCFIFLLDTGSADLWISSTRCEGDLCDKVENKYNHEESSSFQDRTPEAVSKLHYGSGDVYLRYATETVKFANIEVNGQDFAEALQANPVTTRAHIDGILGLSFRAVAHQNSTPFLDKAFEQNLIKQNLFTMCTPRDGDKKGEILLGETSSENYPNTDIVYTPLTKETHWDFKLSSIVVEGGSGNKHEVLCNDCDAIADSGTSHITGPHDFIHSVNTAIGAEAFGDSHYKVKSCDDTDDLPNVQFNIENHPFAKGNCLTVFTVSGTKVRAWILGGSFLDDMCTIYDKGNHRLGFSKMPSTEEE
ncbi:Cathepsin D [Blattella germanica]|nr:Cathepsin D [Blattella germanica]